MRRVLGVGYGVRGDDPQTPYPIPQTPFRYAEAQPSPSVAGLVLNYWSFQADAFPPPDEPYTVFPDGCASVAVVRTPVGGDLALVGPRVRSFQPPVYPGSRVWGIRFWPDAIGPALNLEPRAVRDYFGVMPQGASPVLASLSSALPDSDAYDVVFAAMDAWADSAFASAPDPDQRIRQAIHAIVGRRGEGSMGEVARAASIGLRQLQRLFPEATGLTLREYARVRRLREALAMRIAPSRPGWSAIAAEAGFVDHSHLTREFVALAGLAPSQAAVQLTSTAHRDVRP